MNFSWKPLTPQRWNDFATLFGERGACGGCWCMYWRQAAKEFRELKGTKNRNLMKKLVTGGAVPGIIGYVDNVPAGWAAITPRSDTPRIAASRVMAPVDDLDAWFIPCLFVNKSYRNKGVSIEMIKAACEYAFSQGAPVVEACPNDLPPGEQLPAPFVYLGLASAFRKAGFKDAVRRSPKRPLMRKFPR
jgi:GNAT superfamily N-acetyltransferase